LVGKVNVKAKILPGSIEEFIPSILNNNNNFKM
jgi:hypothetical protein